MEDMTLFITFVLLILAIVTYMTLKVIDLLIDTVLHRNNKQ